MSGAAIFCISSRACRSFSSRSWTHCCSMPLAVSGSRRPAKGEVEGREGGRNGAERGNGGSTLFFYIVNVFWVVGQVF